MFASKGFNKAVLLEPGNNIAQIIFISKSDEGSYWRYTIMAQEWTITGDYLEACNCDIA
jgi:hypothetical protein